MSPCLLSLSPPAVAEVANVHLRGPQWRHLGHVEAGPVARQSVHPRPRPCVTQGAGEVAQCVHDLGKCGDLEEKLIEEPLKIIPSK